MDENSENGSLKTEETYLTVREAASLLKLTTHTLYIMLGRGDLRSVKLGFQHRVPKSEIERLLSPMRTT
jgi:excisionase family DNA binding protein